MPQHSLIPPDNLREALAFVLAPAEATTVASMTAIIGFERYLAQTQARWIGRRCGPSNRPTGVSMALLLPGRTALVLPASPGVLGIEPVAQHEVTRELLADLRGHDLTHAQVLLDEGESPRRSLALNLGFQPLAMLEYLERDASYPWVDPPGPNEARWVNYSDAMHARFAAVIGGSYADTQDCPELGALRTVEDAMAGHRAAGAFDARRWEVATVADRDAGVLLFAPHADASLGEVVYCGVVPEFRHRGIGALLVRRALYHCRQLHLKRLTLVVDARNAPARRLYARMGLERVIAREALLLPRSAF